MEDIIKKPTAIQTIPLDAIFTVSISGGFYARLQGLLLYLSKQKSEQEFVTCLQNLKSGEPKNEYENQLLTVLTMINGCESEASKQGKIKDVTLSELK